MVYDWVAIGYVYSFVAFSDSDGDIGSVYRSDGGLVRWDIISSIAKSI